MLDAGAAVIVELEAKWGRDLDLMRAEARAIIADLRAANVELVAQQREKIDYRLASLKDGDVGEPGRNGSVGDPGPAGPAGAPGLPGDKGDTGEPGEPGKNGADGAPGVEGPPGAVGPVGPPGANGEPGEPGRNGDAGASGAKGDRGEPGRNGEPGVVGAKGEPGEPGRNGEPGMVGAKGDRGDKGEAGPRGGVDKIVAWSDRIFYEGRLVTHKGSCWQAACDTARQPGTSADWLEIAAGGAPGGTFKIRGTWRAEEKYRALDVVTLDYGWFVARQDDPGPIPGPGWQAGPVGRRGEKGIAGERGGKGDPGKSAPHWIGLKADGYSLTAVMSDGAIGPRISLFSMFEQFEAELRLRSK
ncbi:MAG TPA: hypothetical protein VGH47_04500 [Xanthobacteraceae bacterium]|jgi:hypothetical protein